MIVFEPIIWILRILYEFNLSITGSYGFSIIMLSVEVTLIMTPLYIIAEKWKISEQNIQFQMKKDIESIKNNYSGQKRFLLIKETHQLFGYKTWYSLRVSFGLVIQVPFFLAAYNFLSHYSGFSGISYGLLSDLSSADRLFFGNPLMPILMTGINLFSGFLYTRGKKNSEKIQSIILPVVFLLLLYRKPSGLLLYWTMNNAFSIIRIILLKHFYPSENLADDSGDFQMSLQLKKYIPQFSVGVSLILVAFYLFAALSPYKLTNMKSLIVSLLEIVIIYLTYWSLHHYIWKEKKIFLGGFLLLTYAAQVIIIHKASPNGFFTNNTLDNLQYFVVTQLALVLLMGLYTLVDPFRKSLEKFYEERTKIIDNWAALSLFTLIGLIFFWSPLTLHLSDIDSLPIPIGSLVIWHLTYSVITFTVIYLFYRLSPIRIRPVLAAFFIMFSTSSLVYTFLLPGDYGVLDTLMLTRPENLLNLNKQWMLALFEVALLGIFCFAVFRTWIKAGGKLFLLLVVLNILMASQSLYTVFKSSEKLKSKNAVTGHEFKSETMTFSENGNVIIFMLDMFGADVIQDILIEYPELRHELKGFIWYPDMLSTSDNTLGSIPALLSGEEYTPQKINERSDMLLSEVINNTYSSLAQQAQSLNFQMTLLSPTYLQNPAEHAAEWGVNLDWNKNYLDIWMDSSDEAVNLELSASSYTRIFSVIGLFKASPYFIRPFVYMDSRWLFQNQGSLEVQHAAENLAFLDELSRLSTLDDGPPRFKFYLNRLTHLPWAIGDDLKLHNRNLTIVDTDPEYGVTVVKNGYYSSVRALKEIVAFTRWLDSEGILDSTKIILVSDHGYTGIHRTWQDLPVLIDQTTGEAIMGSSRVNSLLMVKDYNADGDLKIDKRLMTTSDIPGIVFSTPENHSGDKTDGNPIHRTVLVNITHYNFVDNNKKYSYNINYQFAVSGDPSMPENWVQITPSIQKP